MEPSGRSSTLPHAGADAAPWGSAVAAFVVALLAWFTSRYVLSPLAFGANALALAVMLVAIGACALNLMQIVRRL